MPFDACSHWQLKSLQPRCRLAALQCRTVAGLYQVLVFTNCTVLLRPACDAHCDVFVAFETSGVRPCSANATRLDWAQDIVRTASKHASHTRQLDKGEMQAMMMVYWSCHRSTLRSLVRWCVTACVTDELNARLLVRRIVRRSLQRYDTRSCFVLSHLCIAVPLVMYSALAHS